MPDELDGTWTGLLRHVALTAMQQAIPTSQRSDVPPPATTDDLRERRRLEALRTEAERRAHLKDRLHELVDEASRIREELRRLDEGKGEAPE